MNLTKFWRKIFYLIKPGSQSGINPETGVVTAQGDITGAVNIMNPGLQVQKTGFVTAAGGPSEEGNILNSKSQVPSKPETSGAWSLPQVIPLGQGTSRTQCYRVQANFRHQVFLTLVEEVEKQTEQGLNIDRDPLATDGEVGQK